MKFRTACHDHRAGESAAKCLFREHNRMARVGFEPRLCGSQARRFKSPDHAALISTFATLIRNS